MRARANASLLLSVLAAFTLLHCGGDVLPAQPGEPCGPDRGCDEGLTCQAGVCVAISGADAGDTPGADGGGHSSDDAGAGADGGGDTNGGADGGTSCGPCNAPPTACHALSGTCANGVCEYAFVEGAPCDDQNACTVADTCTQGACTGTPLQCDAPPANVCVSGSQLKTYDQTGACQGGLCTYNSQTVACGTGGCSNGACQSDPCARITCNTPPGPCFAPTGVCQNGSCTYGYNDGSACNDQNSCTSQDACQAGVCQGVPLACNTPPPNTCENASVLRVYASTGSCSQGQCSYSYGFVTCATGCANAQCNNAGWTVMNSNVTVNLNAVWGASPTSVWAGGDNGTLVFYNGAQWQVRPSGTTWHVSHLHGTSASNVFALASSAVLHYDGTSWATVPLTNPLYATYAIWAVGTKDVLLYGRVSSSSTIDALIRYHQVNGVWQATTLKSGGFRNSNYGYRMWATSLTSVYTPGGNHWNGSTVTQLGQATYSSRGPGRMFVSGSFVLGQDWQNGATKLYTYNSASDSWSPMATGFAGTITDIGGTSPSRVFVVGTLSSAGHVLYYDGVGWTDLQLPAGVGPLRGVWALASGEVFAVGNGGTVLLGP
jgi:hypothetical protein